MFGTKIVGNDDAKLDILLTAVSDLDKESILHCIFAGPPGPAKSTLAKEANALSCLMQLYNSRLQTLTSGPESYMNIKKSLSEIDLQRLVESSPVLKAQIDQRKLFQKGLFNFRPR